ncbi:MAG: hypothetical protein JXQ65_09660 [Candidatus Marinimicrobia bacterium]|nr:hypothetical protein [Candidatus Neomarinimicrobiota bacterium]
MMSLVNLLKEDFTVRKIICNVLTHAIISFLFFLVFYLGYSTSFINHKTMDGELFILPNIIVFLTVLSSFLFSLQEWDKVVNQKAYLYCYKTAGIFETSIFWGKMLVMVFHMLITFFVTALVMLLFSGISIKMSRFLYFFLFTALSGILFIQIAAFIKYWVKTRYFMQTNIVYINILLFLLSGLVLPFYLYSGPLYTVIKFLPHGIIFEGSRNLLLNHEFIWVELLYVGILTLALAITNHILYKKELAI